MNKAYVRITPELLADALKMPKGMIVHYVRHDLVRDVIDILVKHPGIPATELGKSLPELAATYTHTWSGKNIAEVTADWGEWFTEEEGS